MIFSKMRKAKPDLFSFIVIKPDYIIRFIFYFYRHKKSIAMEANAKTLRDSIAFRWIVLVLLSALMFATYWFQDFFSGLKGLMESELGFTSEEFGRLIGLTTIANMFGMIIVGGIVLDKWGIKLAGLVFGGLAAVGGGITAMASAGG